MGCQVASLMRSAAFLSRCLSLAKTCSMGHDRDTHLCPTGESWAETREAVYTYTTRAMPTGYCPSNRRCCAGQGVRTLLLETGIKSFEAVRLCNRRGFIERDPVSACQTD